MGLFGEKKNKVEVKTIAYKGDESTTIVERPRICCIDLTEDIIYSLKKIGTNIFEGTLGSKIKMPKSTGGYFQLLLNFHFPKNLHEFDIIILDLDNYKTIDYKQEEHFREKHTGQTSMYLLSSYPETLFDPRPMASFLLRNELEKISNRQYLVLAFSSEFYEVYYEPVEISGRSSNKLVPEKHNIYSFWPHVPISASKFGTEITIEKMQRDLQVLLEKYIKDTSYNQTFYHPDKWTDKGIIEDEKYFPLMTNMNGDIVSYMEVNKNQNLIILPQIKDKFNFILDFLSKIAPSIYPSLFPFSTTYNWKNQEEYWLPKYSNLLQEKINIEKEFQKKLENIKKKIEYNSIEFSFLHEIISETGDSLTNSLIKYFL